MFGRGSGTLVEGAANDQRVWADGDNGMRNDERSVERRRRDGDREADLEHASVCVGWGVGSGASGSGRRAVHSGSGFGARVSEAGRTDGGTVRSGSVWRSGDADVPDRRCGAVAGGWEAGVSGASGSTGEGAWISCGVGRDRSSVEESRAGTRWSGDSGWGGRGEAAGGICSSRGK